MHVAYRSTWMPLVGIVLLAAFDLSAVAQEATSTPAAAMSLLPDAPAAQVEVALAAEPQAGQNAPAQQPGAGQGSSSSQSGQRPATQPTKHQQAQQQIQEEEKQRVLGVVPTFGTTYHWDAVSLSAGQKMQLAFRSAIDPFTFAAAGMVAGLHEVFDDDIGFGWGAEGYGKRMGAAYLDSFDGSMIGNGILPVLFHQDPRYFRMGHGSFHHRLFYAIATSYICRHDNTGKWEPNYSNVGGNIIAGAISNLYYPSEDSGWGQTISDGFIVTTEGTLGGVFQEFWPDVSRKLLHKDPTHGLDAQMAAEDGVKKKKQPLEPAPK